MTTPNIPDTAFDRIDSVYTLLRDAGFVVTLDGPGFLVGLKNRRVTTTEIVAVLDSWPNSAPLPALAPKSESNSAPIRNVLPQILPPDAASQTNSTQR